jgi:hypothetical protein
MVGNFFGQIWHHPGVVILDKGASLQKEDWVIKTGPMDPCLS